MQLYNYMLEMPSIIRITAKIHLLKLHVWPRVTRVQSYQQLELIIIIITIS